MAIGWGRGAVTAGTLNELSRFHSVMQSKELRKKSQMCFPVQERERRRKQ